MEGTLLARETVNNLFNSQYELFRALLHTLAEKNAHFSLQLLEATLESGAGVQGILWSDSVPSAPHLAWLCLGELAALQKKLKGRGRQPSRINVAASRGAHESLLYVQEMRRCLETRGFILCNRREEISGWGNLSNDRYNWISSGVNSVIDLDRRGAEGADADADTKSTSWSSGFAAREQLLGTSQGTAQENVSEIASEGGFDAAILHQLLESGHRLAQELSSQLRGDLEKFYHAENSDGDYGSHWDGEAVGRAYQRHETQNRSSGVSTSAQGLDASDEGVQTPFEDYRTIIKKLALYIPELLSAFCKIASHQSDIRHPGSEKLADSCTSRSFRAPFSGTLTLDHVSARSDHTDVANVDELTLHVQMRIQVQTLHLQAIRHSVEAGQWTQAIQHLRYLDESISVSSVDYRDVLNSLFQEASKEDDAAETFSKNRKYKTLLEILYSEIMASGRTALCSDVECMRDNILLKEIVSAELASGPIVAMIEHMHQCQTRLYAVDDGSTFSKAEVKGALIAWYKREIFQYTCSQGAHLVDIAFVAAVSSVQSLQFDLAADILAAFPNLQPLLVAMGWDLLFGNTVARKRMMEALWVCRPVALVFDKQSEGSSSVQHLCEELHYRLKVAYFISGTSASRKHGSEKRGVFFRFDEDPPLNDEEASDPADPFIANLIIDHLGIHSPMWVLSKFMPHIDPEDAIVLLGMQPTSSSATLQSQRHRDAELLQMYVTIVAAVFDFDVMISDFTLESKSSTWKQKYQYSRKIQEHLTMISNPARMMWVLNFLMSLLYMVLQESELEFSASKLAAYSSVAKDNMAETLGRVNAGSVIGASQVCDFVASIQKNIPAKLDLRSTKIGTQQAIRLERFVNEWEWRMTGLQRLTDSSLQQLHWKEALMMLRAAPLTFFNICLQHHWYDLGKEAMRRFHLPAEEMSSLLLCEWIHKVDDATTTVGEGLSCPDLAFGHEPLEAVSQAILCLDFAITCSRSLRSSRPLINLAFQLVLKQCQENETYFPSAAKHLLDRLNKLLEQGNVKSIQAVLIEPCSVAEARQGQRPRTLLLLQQVIDDASRGKRQFLSGKLHNLVKALADDEVDDTGVRLEGLHGDKCVWQATESGFAFGLGYPVIIEPMEIGALAAGTSIQNGEAVISFSKRAGKRWLSILCNKPMALLSAFILYIATIGDVVDGVDTTHDFNFFSLMYEPPKDLLTRLVLGQNGQNGLDAAVKIADIMGVGLVQHVISVGVRPVYPPYAAKGWASIPEASYGELDSSAILTGEKGVIHQHLWLDAIKHLMTVSPASATLVCVFRNSRFSARSENTEQMQQDRDRALFELALEQSEQHPILNRWIQMQVNVQELSHFPGNKSSTRRTKERRISMKRLRTNLAGNDLEYADDISSHMEMQTVAYQLKKAGTQESRMEVDNLHKDTKEVYNVKQEADLIDHSDFKITESCGISQLLFDWESQGPYEAAVRRLVAEGKLVDALALADRWLYDGAPDLLLQLLVERGEDSAQQATQWPTYGTHPNSWNNSWQYCIRLRNKNLAAKLALSYLNRWELGAAIDVLTMCKCHLLPSDPQFEEVANKKNTLLQFSRIMRADGEFLRWQEVEALCQSDSEGLALRLSAKGAVVEALEVAESFNLSSELRIELQGRHLVNIFGLGAVDGGGPAAALKFLLQHFENALPIALSALEQLPNLQSKQLLVQFISRQPTGNFSSSDRSRVDEMVLGLRMLRALPVPWQNRCSALHGHPKLIYETLLMWKQWQTALELLQEFPCLADDNLVISYAAKALHVNLPVNSDQSPTTVPGKSSGRLASTKHNHNSSLSRELKLPFSMTFGENGKRTIVPDDELMRQKSNDELPPSQRAAWEAMAGLSDEQLPGTVPDGYERIAPVTLAEDWVLTGDPIRDESVRSSHCFKSAPCAILFKSLLLLCSHEAVAAKAAVELCVSEAKRVLGAEHLTPSASVESIERAFSAAGQFIMILQNAKLQLEEHVGKSEMNHESLTFLRRSNETSQVPENLSELLQYANIWLSRIEVLQTLLESGIWASLNDITEEFSAMQLRDRLLAEGHYSMAQMICAKCEVDTFPVWNSWGQALLQIGCYMDARNKFRQALQVYQGDPAPTVRQIIFTLEAGPPADVVAANELYIHMAKNVYSSSDDSLSADSYLNVLHLPSFRATDKPRRSCEESPDILGGHLLSLNGDDYHALQSNLDETHFEECVRYLHEFCQQDFLAFSFQHGRFTLACQVMLHVHGISPGTPSLHQMPPSPSSSPQRPESLTTDYGSVEDLCEICVGYAAIPILEHVLAARDNLAGSQDYDAFVHTAAYLSRICNYCEVHRHFNHLYRFQLLKKDHVAAGLGQIQLFQFSVIQDEAVRHLEQAKMHFDEGLLARQQAGESVKNVSKITRTRSPSKLTEEELIKLIARVSIQIDVARSFGDTEGPPWKYSLFGNPNDADTMRRRCEIVEVLLDRNFDLAFKIIYEFTLPRYAASLADRKKSNQLFELLRNIKGTIDDEDLDEVLGAAISVYVNKYRERPDRLVEMINSSHRKVLALVICGRLKAAFQLASRTGSVADVEYVAHQAQFTHASAVVELCRQWLGRNY